MGVQEQNNRGRKMLLGEEGNSLVLLLAINAIIFGLFNFIKAAYFLGNMDLNDYYKNIVGWFLVPADAHGLASRPWAVLTYMFTHDGEGLSGVAKLIGNMLWLWVFGYILQDLTGNRHLAPLYLYGGLAGAIFFLLTVNSFAVLRNLLPTMPPLQGANAAVMAIAVTTTVLAPGYRIFPFLNGGIPLWVLTLVFVAVDYAMVAGNGAGLGVAHLAGGFMGFIYAGRLKAGKDWGAWMHQLYKWFFTLFDPAKRTTNRQDMRNEVFYQQGKQPAFRKKPIVTQQKIDDILDKINQQGYHLLTDEEKEYLKTASKEVD